MNRFMIFVKKAINLYYIFLLSILGLYACSDSRTEIKISRDSLINYAPVLTPDEFIGFTSVEEGFEIQTVAAEPQLNTPVSILFDNQNRIWVVEMTNFMTDVEGRNEDDPTGKIVILEDSDGDGYFEKRKVFLDSLVLPRGIAFVDNGILVAEPPRLWYYNIHNDKPYHKTLIDPLYTTSNNVEAQANGLVRGIDNWIYNAASNKRYRKTDSAWVIENTFYRGQWGITQDDMGRLFYNNNSQNLLGDYFLPGIGTNNPHLKQVSGFNERIVEDNATYPSRPTSGVNRGYTSSEVDDSFRLKKFTAACGPLLYRADLFDEAYYQNAFVAEPAGNLIKRNILSFNPNTVTGNQAYTEKEFIRSDDERFRPVNLCTGPDGALYIVDMYRGVIQYKLMLTKYLETEIKKRNLEKPINCGRIYRIVPKGTKPILFPMPDKPSELIKLFKEKNSWKRERAQQILVDQKPAEIIAQLKKNLKESQDLNEYIHSLWTLKGMNALNNEEIINFILAEKDPSKINHLLTALEKIDNPETKNTFFEKIYDVMEDSAIAPYIAFKSYLFQGEGRFSRDEIEARLLRHYPNSIQIAQAILSNRYNQEKILQERLKKYQTLPKEAVVFSELQKILEDIRQSERIAQKELIEKKYERGIWFFSQTCQGCHGADGNGIKNLAPPLNHSGWVTGEKKRLISIVLYGLTGPVTVNNQHYDRANVSGDMPGLLNNPGFVESDVALLLSYIRNNWNNKAGDISTEDIKEVKAEWADRLQPFTEKELLEVYK